MNFTEKTLKQKNKLKAEEEEDEDDAMINDVITSVLTENQSQTLNLQNETLSKKVFELDCFLCSVVLSLLLSCYC